MALFGGKTANVMWDTEGVNDIALAHIQSWSLIIDHDVAEVTSMQETWASFLGGFINWTATIECLLPAAGTTVPLATGTYEALGENTPAKIELYFLYDSVTPLYRCLYSSAICTRISPGSSKDDIGRVTYTFQGTGLLAWHSGTTRPAY